MAACAPASRSARSYRVNLSDKHELAEWVEHTFGVRLVEGSCCAGHASPLDAFAAAYFAENPVVVWKASRGLGGKTVMLALLGLTKAVTLGTGVTLLGGSGEQSQRVMGYMTGTDSNLSDQFWNHPTAPRQLIRKEITRRTSLRNGGWIHALMASTRSVRGAHPSTVLLDEIDEMTREIYHASTGQAMGQVDKVAGNRIAAQMVLSSTWHKAEGTMTYVLEQARLKRWPVFSWCYKETLLGWLDEETVEEKRAQVPTAVFHVEHDLNEPSPERRSIPTEAMHKAFRPHLGQIEVGDADGEIVLEEPEKGALYATGTDWAKDVDWTWIFTYRADRHPAELVAFERTGRLPWPLMVEKLNARVEKYPGQSSHDATGLGKVVTDYLTVASEPFDFVGKQRTDLISGYLLALEHGKIVHPVIDLMESEHKFADNEALFSPTKHLPDTIAAAALGWRAVERARGSDVKAATKAHRRARRRRGEE